MEIGKIHDLNIMSPTEKIERALRRDAQEIDKLRAENAALRKVVEAAQEWRKQTQYFEAGVYIIDSESTNGLIRAIDEYQKGPQK